MNYTRPNDPDHVDNPKEWLNGAMLFGMATGLLLREGTGIVVDIKGETYNPVGDSKKVIIFKTKDQIVIDNFDQDLPEGSLCEVIEENKTIG